jgi:hypothetical protein
MDAFPPAFSALASPARARWTVRVRRSRRARASAVERVRATMSNGLVRSLSLPRRLDVRSWAPAAEPRAAQSLALLAEGFRRRASDRDSPNVRSQPLPSLWIRCGEPVSDGRGRTDRNSASVSVFGNRVRPRRGRGRERERARLPSPLRSSDRRPTRQALPAFRTDASSWFRLATPQPPQPRSIR